MKQLGIAACAVIMICTPAFARRVDEPRNALYDLYMSYRAIENCSQQNLLPYGYAQIERLKEIVKAAQDRIAAANVSIDTDAVWAETENADISQFVINRFLDIGQSADKNPTAALQGLMQLNSMGNPRAQCVAMNNLMSEIVERWLPELAQAAKKKPF